MRIDSIHHVDWRKAFGLESVEVKVDLNLALFTTVREGGLGSLDGGQLGTNGVLAEVIEALLIQPFSGEAKLIRIESKSAMRLALSYGEERYMNSP